MGEKEKREYLKERILAYKSGRRLKVSQHEGDKKSGKCPRCGRDKYDFHDGRWKMCLACGFSTFWEMQIRSVRGSIRHDSLERRSTKVLINCVKYIDSLAPL
ncbi:MAG: hypothetical protein ACXADO_00640 [Candidatus Thorarchaeota archaeon]|jgi:ribosomal protein L37E